MRTLEPGHWRFGSKLMMILIDFVQVSRTLRTTNITNSLLFTEYKILQEDRKRTLPSVLK